MLLFWPGEQSPPHQFCYSLNKKEKEEKRKNSTSQEVLLLLEEVFQLVHPAFFFFIVLGLHQQLLSAPLGDFKPQRFSVIYQLHLVDLKEEQKWKSSSQRWLTSDGSCSTTRCKSKGVEDRVTCWYRCNWLKPIKQWRRDDYICNNTLIWHSFIPKQCKRWPLNTSSNKWS